MSPRVTITRRDLLLTAALMLPSFAVGEWLSTFVFGPADWDAVWDASFGAFVFAALLAFTRMEDA